ncbi:MAG: UMP kinase [Sphaerochaetaceae bacterium]
MEKVTVLSLGGSIIVPQEIDIKFLKTFTAAISRYLDEEHTGKLIIVTGGGAPARLYQAAYREIATVVDSDLMDWLGIAATHLNGTLVRSLFIKYCEEPLVSDPRTTNTFKGRVLVAAGWKPGFSTDTDAVYLAQKFGAKTIINLSNIAKVYTEDPKVDPSAQPLDQISWADFRTMVGDEWVPGRNVPFDPVASREAQKAKLKVICADGRNIENTLAILRGESYEGTLIS